MRMQRAVVSLAIDGAFASMAPATRMARKNCITVKPIPAEAESISGTADFMAGANLMSSGDKSAEPAVHIRLRGGPITGQVSMPAGGGGTESVPSWMRAIRA